MTKKKVKKSTKADKNTKARLTLKERWKADTPKRSKVMGDILLLIAVVATAIATAYTELPNIFQDNLPRWVIGIVSVIGYIGKFLLQFDYIKEKNS